ncbi:MAG: hypothetical protein VW270_18390 [Candidatus Poseidoniales archaeon]|jgi:hypothetical protein
MNTTKDLLNAIVSGNNIEAERIFQDDMANRVGDKLEMQRRDVANSFVKSPVEYVDQEADVNEED